MYKKNIQNLYVFEAFESKNADSTMISCHWISKDIVFAWFRIQNTKKTYVFLLVFRENHWKPMHFNSFDPKTRWFACLPPSWGAAARGVWGDSLIFYFFFLRLSPAGGAGLPPGAMVSACVRVQKQHITDQGSCKSELSSKIRLCGCCWLTNHALLMEFANWQEKTLHAMTRLSAYFMIHSYS